MNAPSILGILNVTEDSFSDGARYLEPVAAIAHGRELLNSGADVIDIGAASSRPGAKPVSPDVEIARLAPVVSALKADGSAISIDSFAPQTQRWALRQGVDYLNDIQAFPYPELYPELASSSAKLIVMHSVQGLGPATRLDIPPAEIYDRVLRFFDARLETLRAAGISSDRLIIDPGMGMFLSKKREASFVILRRLPELRAAFGLPLLVSVSRKSFLRTLVGRDVKAAGAATVAAELFAALNGVDFIRTHEPAPVTDALTVWRRLQQRPGLGDGASA